VPRVDPQLEHLHFQRDELRLHAVAAGPPEGPLVILLHGFPEFWHGWIAQIAPLAAAGFRVIVPDQRGYNLSDKPRGVKSYALHELTADIIAIADQTGRERFFLAGHDWGAAVAWSIALLSPERVARLVIVNVPHPSVMRKHLRTNFGQIRRSWYIFLFQLAWLPEVLFRLCNFQVGTSALLRSSRPGTFSPEALMNYRRAWAQPRALTGMIKWYRAALRFRAPFPDRTVRVPTRILWGEQDVFLGSEMAEESLRYCTCGELIRFPQATHWLQHEEPEAVSRLLIEFFGAVSG
jgi:epoxide hydrolase 4